MTSRSFAVSPGDRADAAPRGRAQTPAQQPSIPAGSGRYLGAVVVGLLVLVALVAAGTWLFRALNQPIATIAIQSEFRHLSRTSVEALVGAAVTGGILSLDLEPIRARLEADPWVESARVRRVWPHGLQIRIEEETPIARWGDHGFVNRHGQVQTIADTGSLAELPHLAGPAGSEREVMKKYRDIGQLLQPAGLKISTLAVDRRGTWVVRLAAGPRLLLGRGRIMDKVPRFLAVWELVLAARAAEVVQVDARYDDGLAVQWRPPIAAGANNSVTGTGSIHGAGQ